MCTVGIITFHNAHNYGACLQAYALQQYLKEEGYEVRIIDYMSKVSRHYNLILPAPRKNVIKYVQQFAYNVTHYKIRKKRSDVFQNFFDQYLDLSEIHYKTARQLKKNPPLYDAYICGSDQIWNTSLVGELSDAFTLCFGADQVKRISYAASIGKNQLSDAEKSIFKQKLSRMNYISVREREAAELLEDVLGRTVVQVVDPVFLLSEKEWSKFAGKKKLVEGKYILVYSVVMNENLIEIVDYISNATGYSVVAFEQIPFRNLLKCVNDASPTEFVQLIRDAEMVIANSFHALAFSILFHKEFWVVPHKETNSRIENLLQITKKMDRQVSNVSELESRIHLKLDDNRPMRENRNAARTENGSQKLDQEIEFSKKYLASALKGETNVGCE